MKISIKLKALNEGGMREKHDYSLPYNEGKTMKDID
jgi:hypothetical protein